jgi:hypothetical protein
MEFDDVYERRQKMWKREHYYDEDYHNDENRYPLIHPDKPGRQHYAIFIINKIWKNRSLRLPLILLSGVLLAVIILVLVALFPLFTNLYDSLKQDGLKGIAEAITGFVDKLWNGSGK